MNILGGNNNSSLPPQLLQTIKQFKSINPNTILQQNPQILQMIQTKNPEMLVRQLCQQKGINFDEFMKALK